MEQALAAADTAWVLAAFTAVVLMVPGLALFYSGMLGVKSALNMIMMVFGGFAVTAVLWVLFGPAAVLGDSVGGLGSSAIPSPTSVWARCSRRTRTEGCPPH